MNGLVTRLMSPSILPYIYEIIRNGKIGICAGNMRIVDIQTGLTSLEREQSGDRFKLVIPYAGLSVTWEVVFFGNDPEFPPDFLFDDRTFEPDIENLESLCNWKKDDSKVLLRVIQELMDAYRKHQVALVEEHSRLQFEYASLIEQSDFSESDVEVLQVKVGGPVNFLIRLPVDFARIRTFLVKDNPGEDSAVLLVTFQTPEGGRITPQLFLSPRVQMMLGGSASLRIPAFSPGGCLMDYVPNVCHLLKNKVEQIVLGFEKKKEYIAAFLSYFGRSVLEYDTETMSRISFLFEWQEFYFIIIIELPSYFPQEKPIFVFQSIYHTVNGKPYLSSCQDYPYSPRWSGFEMAERTIAFLKEYTAVFQRNSIRITTGFWHQNSLNI